MLAAIPAASMTRPTLPSGGNNRIRRGEGADLYTDAYEEAQRIICISDEVRITLERVANADNEKANPGDDGDETPSKLTSSKLAQRLGLKTHELMDKLVASGHLEARDGKHFITAKGKEAGGEFRMSPKFGPYFLWPETFAP